MVAGSALTLAYVDAVVLRPARWYDPRYLVPIFGMIVGNAMNGAALAAKRLLSEMEARRGEGSRSFFTPAEPLVWRGRA